LDICASPGAAKILHHLRGVKIEQVIGCEQCIHCIEDTQTVSELIEFLAQKKTNFALICRNRQFVALLDVADIFGFCNGQLSSCHPTKTFEIMEKLDQLKQRLGRLSIREILPNHSHIKEYLSRTMSMLELLKVFTSDSCRIHPTTKRIPILDAEGRVNAVATLLDVIKFLMDNREKFEDRMRNKVDSVECAECKDFPEASTDEVMTCLFTMMWEKQIKGSLGACNTSSATDMFFNWIHFVRSATNVGWSETARVASHTTVEKVLEQIWREKIQQVYVIDAETKKPISLVTTPDLIYHFCK